jgi:uncharacterized protein YecE (DUF72 family)
VGDYSGTRKDFVKSRFLSEALEEYATVFPTVCFDGAYWRFPEPKQLQKYAEQIPTGFRMALKCTDIITLFRFRDTKDMGLKRGQRNSTYLDSEAFKEFLYKPAVEILKDKLGPIIFEFSPFHFDKPFGEKEYRPLDFVKDLHHFLSAIPQDVMYAVEIRDPYFISPDFTRYLDCLEYHGVSHCINAQTWMPPIEEQLELPHLLTSQHVVVRALTRPGVSHEAAVREFEPYDRTQIVEEGLRTSLARLMHRSLEEKRKLFIYANNRVEGNSPNTLAGILDLFDAQTSPATGL